MALDLCLEGAGWLLMMVDTNAPGVAGFLPRRSSPTAAVPSQVEFAPEPKTSVAAGPIDRRQQVRMAAAELPIDQARAVWLVDVCGYRYDDAAAALRVDRTDIAARVAMGRRAIMSSVGPPAAVRPRGR